MPGRQSHGRPLLGAKAAPKKRANTKSKSTSKAHALDAFAIAQKQVQPDRQPHRHGRNLDLDPERESKSGGKHARAEEDDDGDDDGGEDDDEEEEERPRKKRARQAADGDDSDEEGGSDGSGNEWHMGVDNDDEDSDIDSDEAFGESDDDKFQGFAFRGSSSQQPKKKGKYDESDEEDDDESLGSDAIDLADALDQYSSDEEGSNGDTESGSEEDNGSTSGTEDDDEDEDDPSKVRALQNIIKNFAKEEEMEVEPENSSRMISLQDLGLSAVKDPLLKKSVKLMKKEEKAEAVKKGASKKLDVPLPKRQQDRLLRAAAYEKTTETLDRWNDTVKQNRRADHLVFPLANTLPDAGLDNGELLPLTKNTVGTELEQTIMSIMEESGLGGSVKENENKAKLVEEAEEKGVSQAAIKELWNERRKEREMQSREQNRAKRIKKIKSKTYRRIHRKQRLGEEATAHEEAVARGEIDSEEEREAAHRRRALERVGAKHKESKWAKMAAKTGRAAWDDDFRAGLTDMARRDEELRRRIEGKTARTDNDDDDDSEGTSSSGDDDGNSRLLQKLDNLDDDEDEVSQSNLRKMKFMQRAEAERKRANDELVAQIRREIESGDEDSQDEEVADAEVGRRTYGVPSSKPPKQQVDYSVAAEDRARDGAWRKPSPVLGLAAPTKDTKLPSAPGAAGVWSVAGPSATAERRHKKKVTSAEVAELDLSGEGIVAITPASSKPKPASKKSATTTSANKPGAAPDSDEEEDALHLPLAIRDQQLMERAFAGEDVADEFEAEKEAVMSEDDEKMVDSTMPGWGSWVGDGISKRAQKRNRDKVMTKKEGVKKKDRRDARLERVIINEKRVRKNDTYLASQLPHPFESREQYERSLRLPMGPEWMTKESFQDATKPRVIVKQGIIAPMAKPRI